VGVAQPGGLGGLAGQLGLKANRPGGPSEFSFYQIRFNSKFQMKCKYQLFSEFKPKTKFLILLIKHLLIL
jgi:hypothetical protein